MNLESDRQQNVQMELDFSATSAGEAREAGREATELSAVARGPKSPASTNRLMEEVCERENLREAWRRVKANKGSAGVDGITIGGLTDYVKQYGSQERKSGTGGEPHFSGSVLRPVRRSSEPLRRRPWIGLSNESGKSRNGQKASAWRRRWRNWHRVCGAGAAISDSAKRRRCRSA